MFIYKVTIYLMLLAIQSYKISVLCWDPVVSPNYVKQAASNQASTNERYRSTSWYDSTPVEYANDNEKYDFTRIKIIHKIKSSVAIGAPKVSTLIEKKAMKIKQWPDYNSIGQEKSDSVREHKPPNADQHEKFLNEFSAHGKCMGKCQVKQASVEPSLLIRRNDASTSYRSDLKWMTHYHLLNDEKEGKVKSLEFNDNTNNDLPSSIVIGPVALTWPMRDDKSIADKSKRRINNHRVRRQLRYIPAARYGSNKSRQPPRHSPHSPDVTDSMNPQRPLNVDPAFIHSLLGVFDKTHAPLAPNVQPIRPNEVIVTSPRYVNSAKIYPSPRPGDTWYMKNTERNPSGFGESKRMHTTDMTHREKPSQHIHEHFLPTVRPHTKPKISAHHNYDNIVEANYPKNHRTPSTVKPIQSTMKHLYDTPEIPEQRESYKHHGKDTKYNHYPGKYTFEYHVTDDSSANEFGHQETRNEQITKGNYHVRLPDGRLQRVTYHVDNEGYHANVSYEPNRESSNKYHYK